MLTIAKHHLVLLLALAFAAPVLANTDPTLHQVYEAARAGQLGQAQQMMNQVLRDHPKSAKAHYVAAELYAREGNSPLARQELNTAQALEPGLAFAKPEAVQALQRELSRSRPGYSPASGSFHTSFPWGAVLLILAGIGVLALIFRARNSPGAINPQYPAGVPAGNAVGMGGTSIGSGIAGGLASGLAVGAGVVAGEELARHFLGPDRNESSAPLVANTPMDEGSVNSQENVEMGGADFGVLNDDSWDDGGSVGGDVSGDDWT